MVEQVAQVSDVGGGIAETVLNALQSVLYGAVYKVFYYVGWALSYMLKAFSSMFEVMASLDTVVYNGEYDYLINIFFRNTTVSKIYWGMALIGIVLAFAFALLAVIRKLFDSGEKEKRSYGAIIGALLKSILIIFCMNFIITAVLNSTNLLMQQVNYVFATGDSLGEDQSITYTDEELAAMARVYNTIGNYSMNPSYANRYNLNSCFNELRPDLQYLMNQGVFSFYYITEDENGNTVKTWQSMLQTLANSASLTQDLKMDVYYESVSRALLDIMETLRVDTSFRPLASYERKYTPDRNNIPLDRLVFLMSTTRAAKNSEFNRSASMTDTLRAPYYYGDKDIYDIDSVNQDFDIAIHKFDYIIWYYAAYKLLRSLATIILNCVARIFNMLLLYLIAPPVIAVMPLDDGGKFKQWTTAFVVQSFSVFGTIIAMRVLLLFVPLVMDNSLQLFANSFVNFIAKLVIVYGGFEVAEKATGLITGILADNAGIQSLTAGDMSSSANKVMDLGEKGATWAGGKALMLGGKGAFGAIKMAGKGAGYAVAGAALGVGYAGYGLGKLGAAGVSKLGGKINEWRGNKARRQELKDKANQNVGGSSSSGTPGKSGGGGATSEDKNEKSMQHLFGKKGWSDYKAKTPPSSAKKPPSSNVNMPDKQQ